MKVECKISAEYKEPYAVLHIDKMTEMVAEIISMLEKEQTASPTFAATKDKKPILLNRKTYLSSVQNAGTLSVMTGREIGIP